MVFVRDDAEAVRRQSAERKGRQATAGGHATAGGPSLLKAAKRVRLARWFRALIFAAHARFELLLSIFPPRNIPAY